MKKILLTFTFFILSITTSKALEGINIGASITGGLFSADGAKEIFSGSHSSGAAPGTVTKNTSTEGDEAEGAFVLGSIFIEKTIGDRFALGFDYVPLPAESETTENAQTTTAGSTTGTNKVQIDFENLRTLYATVDLNDSVYAKVGYSEVDVATNEVLATGGSYGDTTLDGFVIGLGYNRDLNNDAFVRVEANYMDFNGATLINKNDTNKKITADGFDGYGARISVGKSF